MEKLRHIIKTLYLERAHLKMTLRQLKEPTEEEIDEMLDKLNEIDELIKKLEEGLR